MTDHVERLKLLMPVAELLQQNGHRIYSCDTGFANKASIHIENPKDRTMFSGIVGIRKNIGTCDEIRINIQNVDVYWLEDRPVSLPAQVTL